MKPAIIEASHVKPLYAEADRLNHEVSFRDYLLNAGFTEYSPRLYMREKPLELIRLTKKKGLTYYRNFENKQDKGQLLDFIRNRSLEEGKVVPNNAKAALVIAMEKARNFIQENLTGIKHSKRSRIVIGGDHRLSV